MSTKLTPAMLELRAVLNEAEALTTKQDFSKRDEARLSVLLAKTAALRSGMTSEDDYAKRWFRSFWRSGEPVEQRGVTAEAGILTLAPTEGSAGGYLVPTEIHDQIVLGLKQVDPLLNPDVVTLIESDTFKLRPYIVPAWDLSTYAAVLIGEANQQDTQQVPTASGTMLNGWTYRASLDASFELEEDDFQPVLNQFATAMAVGFARGVGADLITGSGSSKPQGIVVGCTNSGIVTASTGGVVGLNDIENVYFSVDNIHRNAPKCAWVMNDKTYQAVRKAVDSVGNPLLKVVGDREVLMGKPVLISPTLPSYNPSLGVQGNGSFCVFGDLAHYHVRLSRVLVSRSLQSQQAAEYGIARYTGLLRADAAVVDPAGSSIVYANLHE